MSPAYSPDPSNRFTLCVRLSARNGTDFGSGGNGGVKERWLSPMFEPKANDLTIPNPTTEFRPACDGRIVVVGDLHGHYRGLVTILIQAGLIDDQLEWIGGKTVLVQIGDLFGRGDFGKLCAELLMTLQHQAAEAGGSVVVILGNHEAMLAHDHFKYITAAELNNFALPLNDNRDPYTIFTETFSSAKPLGRWMRSMPAAVVIDQCLFTHGGLEWEWAQFGLHWLNAETEADMLLDGPYGTLPLLSPIASPTGPLWNRRLLAEEPESTMRDDLERTLDFVGASVMIVGHTPALFVPEAEPGRIVRKFDGRLIGVDVGINPMFGGHYNWLEIENGTVHEVARHHRQQLAVHVG